MVVASKYRSSPAASYLIIRLGERETTFEVEDKFFAAWKEIIDCTLHPPSYATIGADCIRSTFGTMISQYVRDIKYIIRFIYSLDILFLLIDTIWLIVESN